MADPQRLARSGQWRRSPRPDPRWRRRGLRAGGGEAACGGPPPSSALRRCAAGPAGRWARSLARWLAGRARPSPTLRHGGRERQAVLEAERQAAGQVSAGPARPIPAPAPAPRGRGVRAAAPPSPARGRWVGRLERPLCLGKGLSGAPTLAMGLGTPLQWGRYRGINPGYGAGGLGAPPARRGDTRGTNLGWGPPGTPCNRGDTRGINPGYGVGDPRVPPCRGRGGYQEYLPWLWGRGAGWGP